MPKNGVQPMCGLKSVQLMTLPGVFEPLASCFRCGPQIVTDWSQLDSLDEDSSATLRPWQSKTFPEYLEDERRSREDTQLRTEEEADRIQLLHPGHHRTRKSPEPELPAPVQVVVKAKKPAVVKARKPAITKVRKPAVAKARKPAVGKARKPPITKARKPAVAQTQSLPWAKQNLSRPKRQNLLEQLGESHQLRERRERKPAGKRDGPGVIFAVSDDPTL